MSHQSRQASSISPATINGSHRALANFEVEEVDRKNPTSYRYRVQLPRSDMNTLGQDEAYFFLEEDGARHRIRLHDYDEIYKRPGLYEQLFYDRLKCTSPVRMAQWLSNACAEAGETTTTLRVLDLGAGNGMMGEELQGFSVARIVGLDILDEARDACKRDRPDVYDAYYVADLSKPDCPIVDELRGWNFDCLCSVATLGFGDIPPEALLAALSTIRQGGWVCFNIKESFLKQGDQSGFSVLIRQMIADEELEVHHMVRYRHRYSIDGEPLSYYGIVGRTRQAL